MTLIVVLLIVAVIRIHSLSINACTLKFSKTYVQDTSSSFIFMVDIAGVLSAQNCGVIINVDSILSNQISSNNGVITLASYSSNPDTTTPMTFSCSLSSNNVNCQFYCIVNTNDQIIKFEIPVQSNPIYQKNTIMSCSLYYSTTSSTIVTSKNSINVLVPPNPRNLITTGTTASGNAGSINSVSLCFVTDFRIPMASSIFIFNFAIQSSNSITVKLGSVDITSSLTISSTLSNQQIQITLSNVEIPSSLSTNLCISNTAVKSSTVAYSNNYFMNISTSGSFLIAQSTSETYWNPSSAASFSNVAISPSSSIVGDSEVSYNFKFISPFTITSSLTIQFLLPIGVCTQTQSIIVSSPLNLIYTCSSNNCNCAFNLDQSNNEPINQGILYEILWKTFINPSSTRPINYQINVYYLTSSSLMISGVFNLNSVNTPNSFISQLVSFDSSTTITNRINMIGNFIITVKPSVSVSPYLNIEIDMPSKLTIQSPACDNNPSNCIFSTTQQLFIKDPTGQALANSNYVTSSFKMKNPSCGGSQSILYTTILYNYQSDDPISKPYGYPAVQGTTTNYITFYGDPCSIAPTLSQLSFAESVQGSTATYEINFPGCISNPTLTHIQIDFPPGYSFGSYQCKQYCTSAYSSVDCSRIGSTNFILIPISNSCTYKITISSVINPLLAGPTDSIILHGLVNGCELLYDVINGPIIATSTTSFILSKAIISAASSKNLATTTYTFQIQLCNGCLISQSSLVSTYIQITWDDPTLFTCNCQSPNTKDIPYTTVSASSPSCTFNMGSTKITNSIFTLQIPECSNPYSSNIQQKIKFTIFQVQASSSTYYTAYISDPNNIPYFQTSVPFDITLTSGYSSTNSPTYPFYTSNSFISYIDLKILTNLGSISLTLVGLNQSQSSGSITIYDEVNFIISSRSSISSSGITFNPFPQSPNRNRMIASSLTSSKIKILINNWFKNPKTKLEYSDISNFGIRIDTYSTSNSLGAGIMGSILLKPLIVCEFPCQQCKDSDQSCTSCYSEGIYYYLFGTACVIDCSSPSQFKYYNFDGVCTPCPSNCLSCTTKDSSYSCKSCTSGNLLFNNNCVQTCPSGYIPSQDQATCIEGNLSFLAALSAGKVIPFPFLIVSIAMMFFALAGNLRNDGNTIFIGTNILLQLSSLILIAFLVQWILCLVQNQGMYVFGLTLVSFLVMIACNIVFSVLFYLKIRQIDKGYLLWSESHTIEDKVLVILSTGFSFHNYRLIYSRYLGFVCMSCRIEDIAYFLKLLKIFSFISIFGVYVICIIGDIVGLCLLNWSTQLNVNIIETLIMSVVVIGFSLYELRFTEADSDKLFGTEPRESRLNDSQIKIPLISKKKPLLTRRSSLTYDGLKYNEFDIIKYNSNPSSPRIQNQVRSKFEQYYVYSPRNLINPESIFELDKRLARLNPERIRIKIQNFKKLMDEEDRKNPLFFRFMNSNEKEEKVYTFNDQDLTGSFDRDPLDNSILIMQGMDGKLRDKKGRQVNRFGYLTDDFGNIYKKDGTLAYTADQFDIEKPEDHPKPILINKERTENKKSNNDNLPTKKEKLSLDFNNLKNNNPINRDIPFIKSSEGGDQRKPSNEDEFESYTKRSENIDPLMEDKPSNYDEFNIHYLQKDKANKNVGIPSSENKKSSNYNNYNKIDKDNLTNMKFDNEKNFENLSSVNKLNTYEKTIPLNNANLISPYDNSRSKNSSVERPFDKMISIPNGNDDYFSIRNENLNNRTPGNVNSNFEPNSNGKVISRNIFHGNTSNKNSYQTYKKNSVFDNRDKIKAAEKVYLQKIEGSSSQKHNQTIFGMDNKNDVSSKMNEDLEASSESNYQKMRSHYQNYLAKGEKTTKRNKSILGSGKF